MRRLRAAALLALLAGGAAWQTSRPAWRAWPAEWLAANALPEKLTRVVAVELPEDTLTALDAALVLRAVLRYQPEAVAFFLPIDGDPSLLVSKLADAQIPVVFTSEDSPDALPRVEITPALPELARPARKSFVPAGYPSGAPVPAPRGRIALCARSGSQAVASNVWRLALADTAPAAVSGRVPGRIEAGATLAPCDARGLADLNPLAPAGVERVAFAQLELQTERSEQGAISAVLDGRFRGRLVAVQRAGAESAEQVVALRNRLADLPAPAAVSVAAVVLAATLPWWSARRRRRALLALMASCGLVLLALAVYAEFRLVAPLPVLLSLPLLALIPRSRAVGPPPESAAAPTLL